MIRTTAPSPTTTHLTFCIAISICEVQAGSFVCKLYHTTPCQRNESVSRNQQLGQESEPYKTQGPGEERSKKPRATIQQ